LEAIAATPAAVALARIARGVTQAELARGSGLSQAYLSKVEKGAVELTGDRLVNVARTLGYPVSFFAVDPAQAPAATACAFPRKRNSLPTSAEKRIRALLEVTRMQVEPLLDDSVPPVTITRRDPADEDWISATEIAGQVRRLAGVVSGPIGDLTSLLEQLGVLVVVRDLGNRRIDAIGQWPTDHRPLILINSTASADRRRFTTAHELGHALLHVQPTVNQEREADQFASELLMPAAEGHRVLKNVDMARLAQLKSEWGMSMAAMLRRAHDLGEISEYRYRQLNIELSASGYRTKEPVQLADEKPGVLPAVVARRTASGEHLSAIANRSLMTEAEFQSLYLEVPA
jgi:Zn-dependent peptidase ImmA (M78 family)/transcriptional regulator with XRE-family HTH domain